MANRLRYLLKQAATDLFLQSPVATDTRLCCRKCSSQDSTIKYSM